MYCVVVIIIFVNLVFFSDVIEYKLDLSTNCYKLLGFSYQCRKIDSGSSVKLLMGINIVQEVYKRNLCSNNLFFLTQFCIYI